MRFLTAPWLISKGPLVLCILLLLAFACHQSWQGYRWFELKNQPLTQNQGLPAQAMPDPEAIARLFEETTSSPEATQTQATDLILSGIFVHSDPAKSSALIAKQGSQTQRYHPGQSLGDNSSVRAIYRDYVEIERNGRLEFLRFPKASHSYEVELEQEAHEQRVQMMEALREQMEAAHAEQDDPSLINMAMESE